MVVLDLLDEGNFSYKEKVALFFEIYPEKRNAWLEFFKTEDQHSRQKLNAGLEEKKKELLATQGENQFRTFKESKHAKKNAQLLEFMPAELREEHARLSPLFRRISQLHARLSTSPDDAHRLKLAKEIVELTADQRGIFDKIDEFEASGAFTKKIVPEKEKVDPARLKNFEVEYQLKLLRSRASKIKKDKDRVSDYNDLQNQIAALKSERYI